MQPSENPVIPFPTRPSAAAAPPAADVAVLPSLLTTGQAAAMVGKNEKTWRRWNDVGLCPEPVRIGGGRPMWRRDELADWIDAGLPERAVWNVRRPKRWRNDGARG